MSRILVGLLLFLVAYPAVAGEPLRPNIVLIMTDDQGYGDVGAHGNPVIRTPHLDRLAGESARLTRFYVSPVCAPTRASLLTGRYNYRTGVTDTYLGRAMMDPGETTLAEYLSKAGYRTGIFGKWHLGDCYPLRAMDQGFDESLVHRGGGIGQPSDPPEATSYFDPVLFHNGVAAPQKGYVSDIITDAAIRFIEEQAQAGQPFLVYLPYNAPHTPLEVPQQYRDMYAEADLSPGAFPQFGQAVPSRVEHDVMARLYGMITNIDDNLGRLLQALDEQKLTEETIVIFLTDNGPQQPRYNAGLRGLKGSVYEGGIRVPMFVRWPGRTQPGEFEQPTAHIDVLPSLLEACGVDFNSTEIDGHSFWSLVTGVDGAWPERELCWQWHRGDVPERYRGFAIRDARWKLLRRDPNRPGAAGEDPEFELYDLKDDPYEQHNVAAEHAEVAARLKRAYDRWFDDVCATRGFHPPDIVLGTVHENPTTLTRQDWRGEQAGWTPTSNGQWQVKCAEPGLYELEVVFLQPVSGMLTLLIDDRPAATVEVSGSRSASIGPLQLQAQSTTMRAELATDEGLIGPYQIVVERILASQ